MDCIHFSGVASNTRSQKQVFSIDMNLFNLIEIGGGGEGGRTDGYDKQDICHGHVLPSHHRCVPTQAVQSLGPLLPGSRAVRLLADAVRLPGN